MNKIIDHLYGNFGEKKNHYKYSRINIEEEEEPFLQFKLDDTNSNDLERNFDRNSISDESIQNISTLPKSRRFKFLFLVLLTLFVAESSRGMVVATLYFYLSSVGAGKEFVGVVVAMFSVGRLIGGFIFGYHYNKRGAKEALAASLLISITGHILFSVGESKWIILVGRFLAGFGTGILSVVRACISASTTNEERSRFFSYSGAVQFLGFAVVPGISSLLSKVDFSIGKYHVNQFNSSGYILAFVNLLVLFLLLHQFLDIPRGLDSDSDTGNDTLKTKRYYFGIVLFVFLNFVARGIISLLETVGTPVFTEVWINGASSSSGGNTNDTSNAATMFLILGCVGLVIFVLIPYTLKVVSEKVVLFVGFLTLGAGALFLIEYKENSLTIPQFITGASLIWSVGSPIAQTIIISSFSKMLGSKPQGVMMGLIAAAGSLGRIVFPLLNIIATNNINFVISSVCAIVSAILIVVF